MVLRLSAATNQETTIRRPNIPLDTGANTAANSGPVPFGMPDMPGDGTSSSAFSTKTEWLLFICPPHQ